MGSASKRTSSVSCRVSPASMAARLPAPEPPHNGEHPETAPETFREAAQRSSRRGKCQLMQHTGTAALLERDTELEQLGTLLAEASEGRGRLVLIEGPPGIGRTGLVAAVRRRAHEHGTTTLAARASELDRDFPFAVVRQLFEPLVAARAPLLRGAAGRAAAVLGEAPAGGRAADGDPSWAHFHALYWLLANLAED